MSAYLLTTISGNQSYGGYLSVDGEKSFAIRDDMTYELSEGHHVLVISSSSDAQNKLGKGQAFLYTHTSSSGAILDELEYNSTLKNLGDDWEISIYIEDGQMLNLSVPTKGSKIIGDPIYQIVDLDAEEIIELETRFNTWRNTPIRSKKKMVWGAILIFLGLFGLMNAITSGDSDIVSAILVMLAIVGVGVLLFVLGFRKKIRRK